MGCALLHRLECITHRFLFNSLPLPGGQEPPYVIPQFASSGTTYFRPRMTPRNSAKPFSLPMSE